MKKYLNLRTNIVLGLIFTFLSNSLGPLPLAKADDFHLPIPGVIVQLSPEFNPPLLKGIKVHPDNPFHFEFILDKGDYSSANLKQEAAKTIKYFLASLTTPEKDMWVNLSPYEKDRIVPGPFGQTEMGRDLLAEDYMLKQITASLIYPEGEIGKKFWKRIYEEAAKKFGTTNIPVNTFNKVWIIPEKAVVYENAKAGTAYVIESKLKVMLEQDYLALEVNQSQSGDMFKSEFQGTAKRCPQAGCEASKPLNVKAPQGTNNTRNVSALGSQIVRELVIPELTQEVNKDKNFTQLRQVYNSFILAAWYKKKIKDSILAQVYENKNKVAGVGYGKSDVEAIYQRYLKAFKKGAYNYIREEVDPVTQQTMPRKYFSGGVVFGNRMDAAMSISQDASLLPSKFDNAILVRVSLAPDRAMATDIMELSPEQIAELSEPQRILGLKAWVHGLGRKASWMTLNEIAEKVNLTPVQVNVILAQGAVIPFNSRSPVALRTYTNWRKGKRIPVGFLNNESNLVDYLTVVLEENIPGFRQALVSMDIKVVADLYRHYVIGYKARQREHGGQISFFIENGGLSAVLMHPPAFIDKKASSGALMRLAAKPGAPLHGFIDKDNKDALKPWELEGDYWTEETAIEAALNMLKWYVPGFEAAVAEHDIGKMADLYRQYVIDYKAENPNDSNAQKGFFYQYGLGSLIKYPRPFFDKSDSPAAVMRLLSKRGQALEGLIDIDNKEALKPWEIEHEYWTAANAPPAVINALKWNIPGFEKAMAEHDIKRMAELYRKYVIPYVVKDQKKYNNGQLGFFREAARLATLMKVTKPFIRKRDNPSAIMSLVTAPGQILEGLVDADNKDALKPWELERGYWNETTAAAAVLNVLKWYAPGFEQAFEKSDIEGMANSYRLHVLGYRANNQEKYWNGQTSFFLEKGELGGLMLKDRPFAKRGDILSLLKLAVPELVRQDNPAALRLNEVSSDRASLTEDPEITARKNKIAGIIGDIDTKFKDRTTAWPAFEHETLGKTNKIGVIPIQLEPGFAFDWSLFGDSEDYKKEQREGWEVILTHGEIDKNGYKINVILKKDGVEIPKSFIISDFLTRSILENNNRKGRREALDIMNQDDFVESVIRKLVATPEDLSENLKVLPDFEGMPITLDEQGKVLLTIKEKGKGSYYRWSVVGVNESKGKGYKALVTSFNVNDRLLTFTVMMTKDGQSFPRVFQIGFPLKEIENRKTKNLFYPLVIDDQLGLRGLEQRFLTPELLQESINNFISLRGMHLGVTNAAREIRFSPFPGDNRRWVISESGNKVGWDTVIGADRINDDNFYEFTVKMTKDGEEFFRDFEIGRFPRTIEVGGEKIIVYDIVAKDELAKPHLMNIISDVDGYSPRKAHEILMKSVGLPVGHTTLGGAFNFWFGLRNYHWKVFDYTSGDGAGWNTEIINARMIGNYNQFTMKFSKNGEEYFRRFQITGQKRMIKGREFLEIIPLGLQDSVLDEKEFTKFILIMGVEDDLVRRMKAEYRFDDDIGFLEPDTINKAQELIEQAGAKIQGIVTGGNDGLVLYRNLDANNLLGQPFFIRTGDVRLIDEVRSVRSGKSNSLQVATPSRDGEDYVDFLDRFNSNAFDRAQAARNPQSDQKRIVAELSKGKQLTYEDLSQQLDMSIIDLRSDVNAIRKRNPEDLTNLKLLKKKRTMDQFIADEDSILAELKKAPGTIQAIAYRLEKEMSLVENTINRSTRLKGDKRILREFRERRSESEIAVDIKLLKDYLDSLTGPVEFLDLAKAFPDREETDLHNDLFRSGLINHPMYRKTNFIQAQHAAGSVEDLRARIASMKEELMRRGNLSAAIGPVQAALRERHGSLDLLSKRLEVMEGELDKLRNKGKKYILLVGIEQDLVGRMKKEYKEDKNVSILEAGDNKVALEMVGKFDTIQCVITSGRPGLELYNNFLSQNKSGITFIIRTGEPRLIDEIIKVRNGTPQSIQIATPSRDGEDYFDFLERVDGLFSHDRALLAQKGNVRHQGGIDLSSAKALTIQNNGPSITFHIDPAMLHQLENAPGFRIGSMSIQPISDVRSFLGLLAF